MSSTRDYFETQTDDPLALNALSSAQKQCLLQHHERVRQTCVQEYSSSRSYQARASKDPEYWNSFSVGQHNLPEATS